MNIPMLKKVRAAILKRPRQFEMQGYFMQSLWFIRKDDVECVPASHCGTAACVAGWTVHLASGNKRLKDSGGFAVLSDAMRILEITDREANRLFYEEGWPRKFREQYQSVEATATSRAKAAAARINHFLRTKGRE